MPPPKNLFRWCTPQLKVEPMERALAALRAECGEKMLMLTGVRLGESAARDSSIALSCARDGAECGLGWFQQRTPEAIAGVLAPCLHWRVCHVWDWLTFYAPEADFPTQMIAEMYGGEEKEEIAARTDCIGCNLASKDVALETLLQLPQWGYLAPFTGLKPLYHELTRPQYRLRKGGTDRRKDGSQPYAPGSSHDGCQALRIQCRVGHPGGSQRGSTAPGPPQHRSHQHRRAAAHPAPDCRQHLACRAGQEKKHEAMPSWLRCWLMA